MHPIRSFISRARALLVMASLAAVLSVGIVPVAAADSDEREIAAYTLDMKTVRALFAANSALAKLETGEEDEEDEDDEDMATIDDIVDRIESDPDAKRAVAAAGLSPREYAVATLAMVQAGLVVALGGDNAPVPEGVNPKNVALIRANRAEIDRLGAQERAGRD